MVPANGRSGVLEKGACDELLFLIVPSIFATTILSLSTTKVPSKLPRLSMKQPLFARASLESFPTLTASRTIHHPHHATITAKPELRKRNGELNPNDPRFIGYAFLGGGDPSNPGTTIEHTCNVNYTLSTSGSFYSCCPTSTNVCAFATNCIGSSYALFPGGTTSRCSSVCATGTVYTATNDNSPIIHVGCGYQNYKALRNGDTDLLAGWPNWNPPVVSAAPTLGYTAATDRAGVSAMYATPTPGQVFDPPTEAVWGPGVTYEATFKFTKVTGGIAGGVVLACIILLCIWKKRQNRREKRTKLPPRIAYPHPLAGDGMYRPASTPRSNAFNPLQAVRLQNFTGAQQGHMPPVSPPPQPQTYPVPAYQIFQPQAQRAGYQHILRDEGHETDHEELVPQTDPPAYVEPAEEMGRGETTRGRMRE